MSRAIDQLIQPVTGFYVKKMSLSEPFAQFAGRFSSLPGTVVLLSGKDADRARYHLLGMLPRWILTAKGNLVKLQSPSGTSATGHDPFSVIKAVKNRLAVNSLEKNAPGPFSAGFMGYLAYDLKDRIEALPRTTIDDMELPDLYLTIPGLIVCRDNKKDKTRLIIPRWEGCEGEDQAFHAVRSFFKKTCREMLPKKTAGQGSAGGLTSNFEKTEYLSAVSRILKYIRAGDIYQANMSQRFEMAFSGDSYDLFCELYQKNPAPFFAYVNAGDHHIVSTSPERFLRRKKDRVETRPIKGTRPRGKTPKKDNALKRDLHGSKKDDAELSMIVDLVRNDIGKVCRPGSVKVVRHKNIEAYENVFHLVSTVKGKLDKDKDSVDLIKAAFPGGSITGCPKIRAMEIIDELEPHRRHIYTGSIGYMSIHDTMDWSIAIRTATIKNDRLVFSVGGGIVYDSDPEDEFEETPHKGKTLMRAFSGKNREAGDTPSSRIVWFNGKFMPEKRARIPVTHLGLQYGYGLFETIRADQGRPRLMTEHLERFYRSWRTVFASDPPDLSWDVIIRRVLAQNGLSAGTAAVKIIAARGNPYKNEKAYDLLVTARPYIHRLYGKNHDGLRLITYPAPRQTPLADHKTLNYLYYLKAGEWAKEKGADEAVILNPDKTVSETNTANILFLEGKEIIRPASSHVLPGVMEKAAITRLESEGYQCREKAVPATEFTSWDAVFLTNSLMGMVPVREVDGVEIPVLGKLADEVNSRFFHDKNESDC